MGAWGVWFCEIERFGYTLQVIGKKKEEAREAIIKEFVRAYKKQNDGADPQQEFLLKQSGSDEYDPIDADYFETFLDELYIEEREFGKVEWT